MEYQLHRNFVKTYRKLPEKLRTIIKRRLFLFCENPFIPELNNHALSGKYEGYRSINITGDYRAVYKLTQKNEAMFVRLGTHSQIYG